MTKVLYLRSDVSYNSLQSFKFPKSGLYKIDLFDFVKLINMQISDFVFNCLVVSELSLVWPIIPSPPGSLLLHNQKA